MNVLKPPAVIVVDDAREDGKELLPKPAANPTSTLQLRHVSK